MSEHKNVSPTSDLGYWDTKELCTSCRRLAPKEEVAKCPNCDSVVCEVCQNYTTANCDRCK